jgi:hypothetical protein
MADTWDVLPEGTSRVPDQVTKRGSEATDPRGEFPHYLYHGFPSLNKEAVGATPTEIKTGGGHPGMGTSSSDAKITTAKPKKPEVSPQYGDVQVKQTKGGHTTVYDDTPGGERVVIKHASGAGIQMTADGSMVIRSKNNGVISIDANGAIVCEGDFALIVKNMAMNVSGDLDLDVKGDYNVNVGGNQTTTVEGNINETSKQKNVTVKGFNKQTVLGQNISTILGASIASIKGNNVISVEGSMTTSAKGVHKTSSQAEIVGSSPRMSLMAGDMSVVGAGGTIGGENIIMYNYNMHTGQTVHATDISAEKMTATTFHGDLNGTAKEAIDANTALTSGPGGFTTTNTAATIDNTATFQPDANLIGVALKNSSRGVKKVLVDPGDMIKKGIDRASEFDGIANRKQSAAEARAKLKDPNNAANPKFIQALLKDGSIGPQHNNPSPPGINRTSSGTGSTGRRSTSSPNFIQRTRTYTKFNPDPKYNPKLIDPRGLGAKAINAKTLVAEGISISTFLSGAGGATNLGHLATFDERAALMRQLVLQAEVIKYCKLNQDLFEDFRIIVAEGVYKPLTGAPPMASDSIPNLRQTGRAIVYELYDDDGNINLENTFEFAEELADNLFGFDKIQLDYDKIDPDKDGVHAQITVVMPEIDEDFNIIGGGATAQPAFKVGTTYNNTVISRNDLVEVDESGVAQRSGQAPESGETAQAGRIEYQLVGKKRDLYVSKKLEQVLAAAARKAGVDVVVITSGGQPGTRGLRKGSTRHDTLDAADLICKVGNRKLNKDNTSDRSILDKFVRACRSEGILAGGMSNGYMGEFTMHVDMLGAYIGGGKYNRSSVVTWRSDQWFINAMKGD